LKLFWTPLAGKNLRAVYDYIAIENPGAAESLAGRIVSCAEILAQYPQMGRAGRMEGTRELVIAGTPFVVIYRTGREQIDVLTVFHRARRWPEKF
jgi:plasmid stabilization system protein ParE